jgi:hypothetical protein
VVFYAHFCIGKTGNSARRRFCRYSVVNDKKESLMERYTISFGIGGTQYAFVPNRNFWLAALLLFCLSAAGALKMGAEHIEMRGRLATLEASIASSEAWAMLQEGGDMAGEQAEDASQDAVQFSYRPLAALAALLNFALRGLIALLMRMQNAALLAQSRFDEMQRRPVALRLGSRTVAFTPSRHFWLLALALFLVPLAMMGYFYYSNQRMQERITLLELGGKELDDLFESRRYKDDVVGFFIDYFKEYEENRQNIQQNYREAFLIQKQFVISKYLIREKVSRPDQLSEDALLELNAQIGALFRNLVLDKIDIEPHVHQYFAGTDDLNKVETALMEQAKYHVPASITLAQSALETAYGRRVVNNNYFGIKAKAGDGRSGYMETTEYYTAAEMQANKSKILSKEKVVKGGKVLYKCKVRDSFVAYASPWASFRAHSVYLANNTRYSPLFTKGKDYEAWADKIGSTKYGGVGYATSPIYGNLLKKIVRRYSLDLLDY